MKNLKTVLAAAVLTALCAAFAFGQTAPRSYYVRADGDDNNNGRSEETPFKTLSKAVEAAKAGLVKTITVIGTISSRDEIRILNPGADEILITGKEDAEEAEKAVIEAVNGISIAGPGKVRFTHIRLVRESRAPPTGSVLLEILSSAVTLGVNTVVTGNIGYLVTVSATSSYSEDQAGGASGTLTMTDNAVVTGNTAYAGVNLSGGARLVMKDTASITGNKTNGVAGSGIVVMSGSAQISGNKENGILARTLTMSNNAQVIGNGKHGISHPVYGGAGFTLILSDSAKVIGNGETGIFGQGTIVLSGTTEIGNNGINGIAGENSLTITMYGKVTISGNKGAGVYLLSGSALTMNGGTISGNTGGVYDAGKKTWNRSGGGVLLGSSRSTFTMNGGTISGNKAEYGAGVYVWAGTFNFKGGTITGNEAEFAGGGVYVRSGAAYTQGGTVSGNTAGDGGDDVFRQ
jgi:hypothetical protein